MRKKVKEIYPFKKTDGFVLPCKKGCPNCKHCTDVFWDYISGIYGCECEYDEDGQPLCSKYENDGTQPITEEEFKKLKEAENKLIAFFMHNIKGGKT